MKNLLLVPAILLIGSLPASADFCFDLTGLTTGTTTIVVGSTTIQLTATGSSALTFPADGLGVAGSGFGTSNDRVDGGLVGSTVGETITFTLTTISGPGGTIEINEVNLANYDPDNGPPPNVPGSLQAQSHFQVSGTTTALIDNSGNPTGNAAISNHTFGNMGATVTFGSQGLGATFNKLIFDFEENDDGSGGGGGGGGAAIPEPSSLALCLLGGCFGVRRRRKRSRLA